MRSARWLPLFLLAGCATPEAAYFTPLNTPPHALKPRSPRLIDVYTYARVVRPMIEVGTIEVRPADDAAQVMTRLRSEAGKIGCDGLLVLPGEIRIKNGNSIQEPSSRAVCVVYTDNDDEKDHRPAAPAKAAPSKPAEAGEPTSI